MPLAVSGAQADTEPPPADAEFNALVFSKTAGFRHGSIPAGIAAIEQLGTENGFSVDATEDAEAFTEENLANYDVVIWLSTTGDVLNADQQAAFESYIQDGGGYAGIHAASDTEYDWAWYGELVGAYFASHPPGTPSAEISVADRVHPSTDHLPFTWARTDEWYTFQSNPRGDVHVLAALDETSFNVGSHAMGHDHPIAWCQDFDGGRSWYTGGGHTNESFSEPAFVEHLLGGIRTAAGVEPADCAATVDESFEQVTLARGGQTIGEPIAMAILPSLDVLHTSRDGRVFLTTSDAETRLAGTIAVYNHDEDGLQGIAIDPDFEENRWVYLYYAPPLDTPGGDAPENGEPSAFEPFEGHNLLSRVKLLEDGTLDLATEQPIIEIEADRGACCHAGGEIDFDSQGNLLLSTGDDSNPFASDGYSPLDAREGRNPVFDARRTSGNTNDLRGKLIRISVNEDGSYDIPEGNLFAPGTELTRPEIYAMGFRNPFRFAVDRETDWVYLGDYGPDAGGANPNRGPGGQVEFNLIKEPGNYGWPFCHGANDAYNRYDFATSTSGAKYDCENLVNDSPHNTGLTELPPAVPAWLPYDGGNVPALGNGSESPMGGPTYRYDPELQSNTKWPEYYDGKNISYEWGRGWIKEFLVDDEGTLIDVIPMLDWLDLSQPMSIEFGPDGSLYVLDYGRSWFGGDQYSGLYRIDYVAQRNPIAVITPSATDGPLPLTVDFDSTGSRDPDGMDVRYEWDFDNDGTVDATTATASHTFTEAGVHTVRLNVIAGEGTGERIGTATVNITAGNTRPTVELVIPEDGSIFGFGDEIPFEVIVTDPEDGEIDCDNVIVEYILGHDSHGHPLQRTTGCEGTIATMADEGHGLDANIFGIVDARYADQGAEGVPSLTGSDQAMLRLRQQQAEFFTDSEGVNIFAKDGAAGGQQVGDIHNGDWISFDPMNFVNIDGVAFRYTSGGAGGTLEVRQGAVDGHLAATVELSNTGGWEVWDVSEYVEIDDDGGDGPVYFVFTGHATEALFDIDEIRFSGRGAASNAVPLVSATATPTEGTAPLEVTFSAQGEDPDGDEITYAWDFGDGATASGADAVHTYVEPGDYTATVTVTDADGALASAQIEIRAVQPPTKCFSGRSDDFSGDALDTERWSVLRPSGNLRVADGHLVLPTSQTDIYGTNNTESPDIVLQDLPEGPFTVTTKVTMDGTDAYQQGGLLIYGDDDNYAKMVFQQRNTNNADRIFQFIREENGEPNEVDASNSPTLGADYPSTVWVRFTSDGENLNAHYSADGETFTAMAETKALAGIDNPRVGLFAVQGSGQAQAPVDAAFDYFTITPDDTAVAGEPSDEFDGTALDDCRWDVVRPDPDHLRVADGQLHLDATPGDIYGTDNQTPANFVLQSLDGDWTVETVVDSSATTQQYEQGGLIVYVDDDNYVKLDVLTTNQAGQDVVRIIEIRSEIGGTVQNPQPNTATLSGAVWHLRLTKAGDTITGSYSADGESWTDLPAMTNAGVAADGRVGLFALGAASQGEPTLSFDYFRVLGDEEPEPVLVPVEKVSLQLFSLIPWVNADGLPAVLNRLASIGLENIEPFGGNFNGYDAASFRALTDSLGLAVPSSHYNVGEAGFDATLDFVEVLGQEYVGSGGFAAPGINTYENTLATAATMDRLGERSVAAGIGKFFGHNHAGEFTTTYEHDGEVMSAWEILVAETNPDYVTFQLDVAWAAHAGVDVVELLEEHGDRIELLHIKDATNLGGSGSPTFAKLGEGEVPLQDILRAAEEHADIAYYVMEYDVSPVGEAFAAEGFEYLTGIPAGEATEFSPVEVTPAAVTFDDEAGTFMVPSSVGVQYYVGDDVVAAGTHDGEGTVTVTAQPRAGFAIAEGATTEWSHTFTAPEPEPVLVPVEKVSLGLFSLIPWVGEDGLPAVLNRLASIGFENIEPFGGNFSGYDAASFRALTDSLDLAVPSSHYNVGEDGFDATLAFVDTLGQVYVGSGGFPAPGISTYENTLATAETMDRLGQRAVEAGVGKLFGHNHHTEFLTTYEHDGEVMSAWEILVTETNPEFVTFQVDVAWAAHAGVDVVELLEEYGDRIELLHIKDATGLGGDISFTKLGEGDVPLQEILAAAEEHAEIALYVMEYDVSPVGEEFAAEGFEYLTGIPAGEATEFSPVEVTPAAVTFDDQDGTEDDTFTVPTTTGVQYYIGDEVIAAGTHAGEGTVTVTAQPRAGFAIAEGAATEWSHTFSSEGGQPQPSSAAEFHLSNDWRGTTHHFFKYGRITDEVFVGDWDGNGTDTIALRRGNWIYVSNAPRGGEADWVFQYGRDSDVMLAGDWDGDGRDTFAVRRGSEYHVKNELLGGPADVVFHYGRGDDVVLVGDWDGNGSDTLAVRRGATYHVRNSLSGGAADVVFTYGRAGDVVLAGDWDGDGADTLAVRRGAVYHVRNSLSGGPADTAVQFGRVNDEVFVGDWDGNGTDTLGIRRGQRPGVPGFRAGVVHQ